jgi:outer membrane protein OmpA-like peptidoglycan-associated protein
MTPTPRTLRRALTGVAGYAYEEVAETFDGLAGKARLAALRGDRDSCYAYLSRAKRLVAARSGAAGEWAAGETYGEGREGRVSVVEIKPGRGYWDGKRGRRAWGIDTADEAADIDFYAVGMPQEAGTTYRPPWAFVERGAGDAEAAATVALLGDLDAALVREIEFPFDSPSLTEQAQETLREVQASYDEIRRPAVLLTGYASPIGPENYNLQLSQARVQRAEGMLAQLGIPEDRIKTRFLGERNPEVAASETERSPQNRRVEIRVISERDMPRRLRASLD